MQPMATLMENKILTSPPEKHEKVCFCHKKRNKKLDIRIMLLVSEKHYCHGNNGELGRVAGDVQRAGGVVREDAVWWQHEL